MRLGHAVAGAGQVADLLAADGEVEADGLDARRRLKQLQRDVAVTDFDALVVVNLAADFRAGDDLRRGGLRRAR